MTEPDELNFTVEQEKWVEDHLVNPAKLLLIATCNEEVIGMINFSNEHFKRIAHTGPFGISVSKVFRDQGIGKLLLESLIKWAASNPLIEKINLNVHSTNERAIGLYKKLGFIEEGRRTKDLKYGPDHYVDTVLMGKWVN